MWRVTAAAAEEEEEVAVQVESMEVGCVAAGKGRKWRETDGGRQ